MILEPQKFFKGSHDLTTPLSGTVCHPQAVTCTFNLYIKSVVFAISSPITKMHKAMQNVEIEVV